MIHCMKDMDEEEINTGWSIDVNEPRSRRNIMFDHEVEGSIRNFGPISMGSFRYFKGPADLRTFWYLGIPGTRFSVAVRW